MHHRQASFFRFSPFVSKIPPQRNWSYKFAWSSRPFQSFAYLVPFFLPESSKRSPRQIHIRSRIYLITSQYASPRKAKPLSCARRQIPIPQICHCPHLTSKHQKRHNLTNNPANNPIADLTGKWPDSNLEQESFAVNVVEGRSSGLEFAMTCDQGGHAFFDTDLSEIVIACLSLLLREFMNIVTSRYLRRSSATWTPSNLINQLQQHWSECPWLTSNPNYNNSPIKVISTPIQPIS